MLKQGGHSLTIGILLTPFPRQLAAGGRREHGLAEALENAGDAVEALAARVHSRQQGVEFVGDALLLGEGGEGDLPLGKARSADVVDTYPPRDVGQRTATRVVGEVLLEVLRKDRVAHTHTNQRVLKTGAGHFASPDSGLADFESAPGSLSYKYVPGSQGKDLVLLGREVHLLDVI